MNFFNVKLEKEDGNGVCAVFGENKIIVPQEKINKLVDESYIGKEVIMGIRPENIDDAAAFVASASRFHDERAHRSDRADGLRNLPVLHHFRQGRERYRPR